MRNINDSDMFDDNNLVFITGLYKCGTSWLLQALSRHSEAVGLREIDFFKLTHHTKPPFKPYSREAILANILGRNAWCKIPGKELEVIHKNLKSKSAATYSDALSKYKPQNWRSLPDRRYRASELPTPLTLFDLPRDKSIKLMKGLFSANSGEQVIKVVKNIHDDLITSPYHLVLKGADQIIMLPVLKAAYPNSKKLVIMRDGRDAAISAYYYRKLQTERQAPWVGAMKEPLQFLKDWKGRAQKVIQAARNNELAVVRYEDFIENFEVEFAKILDWLNWKYTPSEVEAINVSCSFEAQTGRKRGQDAKDVKRKGISGEWQSFFSDKDKNRAWELAGDVLETFGYTREGDGEFDFPGKL